LKEFAPGNERTEKNTAPANSNDNLQKKASLWQMTSFKKNPSAVETDPEDSFNIAISLHGKVPSSVHGRLPSNVTTGPSM
jgi:hypothetical protein